MIGDRQRYGHLAIGLLAELSAILVVHADRMLALLWERRVVDNPRLDRLVLLDCVQLHSATFGQHFLVRRRRDTDKVQQQLVLRRRPRRSCPRRHRLHALALPGQHQPGAVVAQRPCPVRVADHARKSLHIRRKPRFAILALLEIHLALRMPKSESLQLFDSQPQRLRPSDSVRLAQRNPPPRPLNGGLRYANPPYATAKETAPAPGLRRWSRCLPFQFHVYDDLTRKGGLRSTPKTAFTENIPSGRNGICCTALRHIRG